MESLGKQHKILDMRLCRKNDSEHRISEYFTIDEYIRVLLLGGFSLHLLHKSESDEVTKKMYRIRYCN